MRLTYMAPAVAAAIHRFAACVAQANAADNMTAVAAHYWHLALLQYPLQHFLKPAPAQIQAAPAEALIKLIFQRYKTHDKQTSKKPR